GGSGHRAAPARLTPRRQFLQRRHIRRLPCPGSETEGGTPVNRLVRLCLLAFVVAVAFPSGALAASRMYIGFFDDAAFRWRPDRIENLDRARDAHATLIHAAVK